MSTGRRWAIGRRRLGRHLPAVVAIAAADDGLRGGHARRSRFRSARTRSVPRPRPSRAAAPTTARRACPDPRADTENGALPRAGPGASSVQRRGVVRRRRDRPDPLLPPGPGAARDFTHESTARRERFPTYDVLPVAFAAQLDWLLANGYTTILPRDLAAHWDQGTPLPAKPVIITLRRRIA